jgi:recombination associated protein RdgC
LLFAQPVDALLKNIFFGTAAAPFAIGRQCRMQDLADAGSIVRWTDFDLTDKTIRDHVANGMRITHLAVTYDNVMSFVLDENGIISRLRFIGMDDDSDDQAEPLAKLDAGFVLLGGTLRKLLADLKSSLGGFA